MSTHNAPDNVITCADMITRVFTNIERKDLENANRVFGAWRRTVASIKPNGANIAAHSQVIDLKNGILLVEADHPGWIQMLQLHQKYVLTGLRRAAPDLHIASLAFRLRGSDAALSDAAPAASDAHRAHERAWLQKQLDREEAALKAHGFAGAASGVAQDGAERPQTAHQLPPELQSLFSRFKDEMAKK